MEDEPRTPAELPMKVPLLVTELRIALIRNLALDTARGFFAPSRNPHNPPSPRPRQKTWACDGRKTIRTVASEIRRHEPERWIGATFHNQRKMTSERETSDERRGRERAEMADSLQKGESQAAAGTPSTSTSTASPRPRSTDGDGEADAQRPLVERAQMGGPSRLERETGKTPPS